MKLYPNKYEKKKTPKRLTWSPFCFWVRWNKSQFKHQFTHKAWNRDEFVTRVINLKRQTKHSEVSRNYCEEDYCELLTVPSDLSAQIAHLSKGSLSFISSLSPSSPLEAGSGFASSFVTSTPTSNTTLQREGKTKFETPVH